MKRFFTLFLLSISLIQIFAQNGIIGAGFTNGWTNPGNIVYFDAGAGSTRIKTLNPRGTGNQYFRFVRAWSGDNTEFGPFGCTDVDWSSGVGASYANMPACSSGAFFINCANTTDNYVFKTRNGDVENDFAYFRIQGTVRSVTGTSRSPSSTINENINTVITATLDGNLSAGQSVFLRYTKDNFATSTIVKMTGGSSTYTATIPESFYSAGNTVVYYMFTSGDVSSITHADADYFTINLLNNGGSNYSFVVDVALSVELSNLTAKKNVSKDNQIDWITSSEKHLSQFNIQRSTNNQSWQTIGTVKATNNPSGAQYNFTDEAPLGNINYYRLQMVDNEGKMTYSKVVSVSSNDGKKIISCLSEPCKNRIERCGRWTNYGSLDF